MLGFYGLGLCHIQSHHVRIVGLYGVLIPAFEKSLSMPPNVQIPAYCKRIFNLVACFEKMASLE